MKNKRHLQHTQTTQTSYKTDIVQNTRHSQLAREWKLEPLRLFLRRTRLWLFLSSSPVDVLLPGESFDYPAII